MKSELSVDTLAPDTLSRLDGEAVGWQLHGGSVTVSPVQSVRRVNGEEQSTHERPKVAVTEQTALMSMVSALP